MLYRLSYTLNNYRANSIGKSSACKPTKPMKLAKTQVDYA